jgi:hypothetical protein
VFDTPKGKVAAVVTQVIDKSNKVELKYSLIHYTDIDNFDITIEDSFVYLQPKNKKIN